jgi:hypothetical protein
VWSPVIAETLWRAQLPVTWNIRFPTITGGEYESKGPVLIHSETSYATRSGHDSKTFLDGRTGDMSFWRVLPGAAEVKVQTVPTGWTRFHVSMDIEISQKFTISSAARSPRDLIQTGVWPNKINIL